jgi:malate/lactate dehydrogenase
VTGAAGQIAYSFIPQLLIGNVFGSTKIHIRLLDIASKVGVLKGVLMEIKDSAFPLCLSIEVGDDPRKMFAGADVIVFIGGFPRTKGMERKDLLQRNKNIFVEQAKALECAKPEVKCLVVANPANTNAAILARYSSIPLTNITCLARLDHNRAMSQIADKTGALLSQI